jgi:hypothetical protein
VAGHNRAKDGVASLAYVPAIHVFAIECFEGVDARHKAGRYELKRGVFHGDLQASSSSR